MKRVFCIVCLFSILISLGACSTSNMGSNIAESSSTTSSTLEQDYEMIIRFYDAVSHLNTIAETHGYSSLGNEVDSLLLIMTEFEEYAGKSNSDYKTYYDRVLNDMWYVGFKNCYAIDDSNIDSALNDSLFSLTHAYIISEYLTKILAIELPFEYDIIEVEDTIAYKNLTKHICATIDSAIDNGLNTYRNASNYTNFKAPITHTANGNEVELDLGITFSSLPNYSLELVVEDKELFSPVFDKITSFEITNGSDSVELNSNYEENLYSGFSIIYFYNTYFTDQRNEKFDEIRKIIIEASTLSFIINETITIELTPVEIEAFKQNVLLFAEIKKMCEFKMEQKLV